MSNFTYRNLSRRNFLKNSAAASLSLAMATKSYAAGSDKIRVGVLGCGERGIYDSGNCLNSSPNVEITACADLFPEQIENFVEHFEHHMPEKINVKPQNRFSGFDAYKHLLSCDIDLVIMTDVPHFRPKHFRAAIEAGKHVFLEKPVAVDPVGARSVLETAQMADQKNLTVVAGTQMRRLAPLVQIMQRIHRGDLGKISSGQCFRLGPAMRDWGPQQRSREWSDMEWQIRRWLFYTWLAGDFIVEQHVHNIDLINWALQSHPLQCTAIGGRQARTEDIYGDVYDHMAVEYVYPDNVRVQYMGAQIDGGNSRLEQRLFGSAGSAYFDFGTATVEGENQWRYEGPQPDPCLIQHADQISAIRQGKKLNEAAQIAESSLTAIMGRMSAYTGRTISWNWLMNASQLDMSLDEYGFGQLDKRPAAIPGQTPLI